MARTLLAGELAWNQSAASEFAGGILAASDCSLGVFTAGTFVIGAFSVEGPSVVLLGLAVFALARYKKTVSAKE